MPILSQNKIFLNLSHGDFAFRSLLLSPSSLTVAFSVARITFSVNCKFKAEAKLQPWKKYCQESSQSPSLKQSMFYGDVFCIFLLLL